MVEVGSKKSCWKFIGTSHEGTLLWWQRVDGNYRNIFHFTERGKFWEKNPELCDSRGPRIGSDGMPVCRKPKDHKGLHQSWKSDGWGHVTWGIKLNNGYYF